MTLDDLQRILHENNINEKAVLILPSQLVEGALILTRTDDRRWRVLTNERGIFVLDKIFESENNAFKFFLKEALGDPTLRKDFKQSDFPRTYEEFQAKRQKILETYGLDGKD